jgi:hypothetical protein
VPKADLRLLQIRLNRIRLALDRDFFVVIAEDARKQRK